MNDSVHVFIYLTGPGWHIFKEHGFLARRCEFQFPITSQLGCSHAALSTALTGVAPSKHGHFSSYYFKKCDSAFEGAQRFFNKLKGKKSGYVGKYYVPFRNLSNFIQANHHGKRLQPGSFAPLISVVDMIHEKRIPNFIINSSETSPIQALKNLRSRLEEKVVNFAFIEIDEMDSLLHHAPHNFPKIDHKLQRYEKQIKKIIATGNAVSSDFNLTVFSGHGMTFAPQCINIKKKIESLGMRYGDDYHAVYDPTMARFWYNNKSVKSIIVDKLRGLRHCRILTPHDKKTYGINFPDHRYGETIALVDPGFQIVPNDVLAKPAAAMHGYDPNHPDSLGACLSTRSFTPEPENVKDFYDIMTNFISKY
jgi:hypothetical protein